MGWKYFRSNMFRSSWLIPRTHSVTRREFWFPVSLGCRAASLTRQRGSTSLWGWENKPRTGFISAVALWSSSRKMVAKQRIRMANEKHSKNITQRGNVAKTLVSCSHHGAVQHDIARHRWRVARRGCNRSAWCWWWFRSVTKKKLKKSQLWTVLGSVMFLPGQMLTDWASSSARGSSRPSALQLDGTLFASRPPALTGNDPAVRQNPDAEKLKIFF